jgi:glycosyltransferase involved in cell wall biosynthesis
VTERVRVLAAIDSLEVGGAQQHLCSLALGLAARGYEVTVATSGPIPPGSPFSRCNLPIISLLDRAIAHQVSPTFTAGLERLITTGRFDLVHAHLHGAAVSSALASRRGALPLVITQHSMGTWQSGDDRAWSAWAARRARRVIAVSRNVAAQLARAGTASTLIPNGVQLPPVHGPETRARMRARLRIPRQAYVAGFAGRLVADKDPLLFLDAAALVARRLPSAHFLIAGDGPLRAAVQERIRRLRLEGRCTVAGVVAPSDHLMAAIDVLALTSRSEAAPLAVLEAMAAGKPVVATAVGDAPYQVRHGKNGLVLPRERDHLADALIRLADPRTRLTLGAAGRERVARAFPLERMVERTAEVYAAALGLAPAGRLTPPLMPVPLGSLELESTT